MVVCCRDATGSRMHRYRRVRVHDMLSEGCMKKASHTRDNWKARRVKSPPNGECLERAAGSCRYVGSPYHKSYRSSVGMPQHRPDTSKCPIELKGQCELIERWLRNALMSGQVGALWEGGFPRFVWHCENGIVYEARQGSPGSGVYHGYPLEPHQKVKGL